jgi:nicotinate-nucleotide pyrophosphorylase (carboxylating)
MRIDGRAASILTAERTALNFVQRLTGIATLTAAFVARVKPFGVTILDTRKPRRAGVLLKRRPCCAAAG